MRTTFWSINFKGKPAGKPKSMWEITIKMDLKEVRCVSVDLIQMTQNPVAGSCDLGNEPSGSVKDEKFHE
jgi:hypothetical protein